MIENECKTLIRLNRISKHLESILRKNQNGLRKGRSTLPQILALRRITEEIKIANDKASIVFVDFFQAFYSISKNAMLHILHLYGLPDKIIAGIKTMYDNPETLVLSPDGSTDSFFTTTGILQGDTLAPYLFIIIVDYILCISLYLINNHGLTLHERKFTRHPSKHITDLDYADDIALLSDQIKNAEILVQSLESLTNKVGLTLNSTKTECMLLNEESTRNEIHTLNGTSLNTVDDFKYLGSYIKDSENGFNTRKALAWSACNKLHLIWKSNISKDTKLAFFRASV